MSVPSIANESAAPNIPRCRMRCSANGAAEESGHWHLDRVTMQRNLRGAMWGGWILSNLVPNTTWEKRKTLNAEKTPVWESKHGIFHSFPIISEVIIWVLGRIAHIGVLQKQVITSFVLESGKNPHWTYMSSDMGALENGTGFQSKEGGVPRKKG